MGENTDWSFGGTWPYEPRWFETPDGRMHYVDEGPRDGRPVVLVHGNPAWGILSLRIFRRTPMKQSCRHSSNSCTAKSLPSSGI